MCEWDAWPWNFVEKVLRKIGIVRGFVHGNSEMNVSITILMNLVLKKIYNFNK